MAYNFTDLTAAKSTTDSIKAWVNHDGIPSATILVEAEAWIYNRFRAWEMVEESTWTCASGQSSIAIEGDFLSPIKLFVDGGSLDGLEYVHEALFDRAKDVDGSLYTGPWPSYWTIANGLILFDIELTEARAGDLWYYEQPAALSATNTTNFLTDRYPTLLRRTCQMFGYEWLKDWGSFDRSALLAEQALELANQISESARRGQEW